MSLWRHFRNMCNEMHILWALGLQEDLANRLAIVQVLMGGRRLDERKGAIDLRHYFPLTIPCKELLNPTSNQVSLVPEMPYIRPKGAPVVVHKRRGVKRGMVRTKRSNDRKERRC